MVDKSLWVNTSRTDGERKCCLLYFLVDEGEPRKESKENAEAEDLRPGKARHGRRKAVRVVHPLRQGGVERGDARCVERHAAPVEKRKVRDD